MNIIKTIVCGFCFFCLSLFGNLWADTPQEILVGHGEKEEKLVAKVEAIVVGQFLSLGDGPDADSAGMGYYDNAQVKIQQSLKGQLSGTLTVSYSVQRIIEKESAPQIAKDYIFFIKIISPTQLSVAKMLPATDDKIAKIKALLAAAPAAK